MLRLLHAAVDDNCIDELQTTIDEVLDRGEQAREDLGRSLYRLRLIFIDWLQVTIDWLNREASGRSPVWGAAFYRLRILCGFVVG